MVLLALLAFVLELGMFLRMIEPQPLHTAMATVMASTVLAVEVYRLPVFERTSSSVETGASGRVKRVCAAGAFCIVLLGVLLADGVETFIRYSPTLTWGSLVALVQVFLALGLFLTVLLLQRRVVNLTETESGSNTVLSWQLNALAIYLMFLAVGGDFFLGLVVMPAFLLVSYLRVTGFEKPHGLIDVLYRIVEDQERMESSVFSEIFVDREMPSVLHNVLFMMYPLVFILFTFNIRFFEVSLSRAGHAELVLSFNGIQMLFLFLLLASTLCVYPAIIQRWSGWKASAIVFSPFLLAVSLSFWEPSAMPLVSYLLQHLPLTGLTRIVVGRTLTGIAASLMLGLVGIRYLSEKAVSAFRRGCSVQIFRRYSRYSDVTFVIYVVIPFALAATVLQQPLAFVWVFFFVVCPAITLNDIGNLLTFRDLSRGVPEIKAKSFFPRVYEKTPSFTTTFLRALASPVIFLILSILPVRYDIFGVDSRFMLIGVFMSLLFLFRSPRTKLRLSGILGFLSALIVVLLLFVTTLLEGRGVLLFEVLRYMVELLIAFFGGLAGMALIILGEILLSARKSRRQLLTRHQTSGKSPNNSKITNKRAFENIYSRTHH